MKEIEIPYGKNKKIIVTKDFLTIIIGIGIIVIDALLAGIIQLFTVGFNPSYILDADFWIAYLIKLFISYIALFGAYIIKRTINKTNKRFVVQRAKIRDIKESIVDNKKIGECEDWLKNVYNYKKKIDLYKSLLKSKYEKLSLQEPEMPIKENYKSLKKYNFALKKYKRIKSKFDKEEKTRIFIEEQLSVCETHYKIINCYKEKDNNIKELQESIKDIDKMKRFKLKIKPVTYSKLFNVELNNKRGNDDSIEYNEGSIFKKILLSIFIGVIFCAVLTSIIIGKGNFSWDVILIIFLNLLLIAWYVFNGIKYADTFVLEIMFTADFNRLCICEEFLEYSNLVIKDEEKKDKE